MKSERRVLILLGIIIAVVVAMQLVRNVTALLEAIGWL